MEGFVGNLDKLRKAGCDLFAATSGNAMMGVSDRFTVADEDSTDRER